jgi:hypothetical protein
MSKKFTILFTTFVVLSFSSCKRSQDAATVPVNDFPSIENIVPLQFPDKINVKGQTDNFELLEAQQDNGFLMVKVAYSGGCNEHFFEASWDRQYMKSLPPQVNIRLTHVNNDDACRERIEKKIAIDLRDLFLNTPNQVSVILNGNLEGKILVSPQE